MYDGIITNCDSFFITKCDTVYYKLRQVLQSAMIITNCDSTPLSLSYIYYKGQRKTKNLPSSHFSPLHCGLHEQAKASFSLSNKQEPPLRHPAIRQPFRKSHLNYFSKRYSFNTIRCLSKKTFKFIWSLQCVLISQHNFLRHSVNHICAIYILNLETKINSP